MRKKFLSATILTSLVPFIMASSSIENPIGYQNGFANISLNSLDWSQRADVLKIDQPTLSIKKFCLS